MYSYRQKLQLSFNFMRLVSKLGSTVNFTVFLQELFNSGYQRCTVEAAMIKNAILLILIILNFSCNNFQVAVKAITYLLKVYTNNKTIVMASLHLSKHLIYPSLIPHPHFLLNQTLFSTQYIFPKEIPNISYTLTKNRTCISLIIQSCNLNLDSFFHRNKKLVTILRSSSINFVQTHT